MHRLMVEENTKRKQDGQAPLNSLPKPCDYFDLIGGTSTGGIIALMLGRLRMDVDKAIKCYDDLAKDVFSDPKRWGGDGKFKATKLEEAIKSVVKDVTGDSESPLLEGNEAGVCRTFVCTKNAHNANIPVLFRTYQSRETHVDCKIWEAARATSAAPTFFKRIEIGREQPFIDDGMGRNNPSRVVLEEANALFGARQVGCLVSIGTGQADIIAIKKPGLFQQIVPIDVIDALRAIATDCEDTHQAMLGLFANSPNTYFRLNVEQGMQGIQLAEWEKLSIVEAHTTQYMKRKEVVEKLALLVNAIRVPRAQLMIEQFIAPRPPVESIQCIKEHKLCPLPVRSFTGRKDILDKMRRYFDSDGKFQSVFVLYGLGGSGKSQLAFKFLQESQDTNRFSDIFYIDATNEQTLQMDLKAITPGNVERSVDASLHWLASQRDGNWLLLFDNADNVALDLGKFFPRCASGNILVTTRNPELRIHAGKGADAKVMGMDHEDAKNLLLQLSREEESDENKALAELVVQELHYFALAVSQAGGFIQYRSSLSEYRELYRRERDNLLQNKEVQGEDQYGLAVYATWRLSYDKLDPSARSFLQICSMLHHEGISEQMFEKATLSQLQLEDSELQNEVTQLLNQLGKHDLCWESWVFRQVVKHLISYSLIEYDRRNHTYSIHPLVQHWSGTTMAKKRHDMQKCILTIIGLSISWTFKTDDYKYRRMLLQHITNSIASLKLEEISLLVASRIALVYSEQGHWNDAEALEVVVMEKSKRVGDDHPDTLTSMANLAATYRDQGHWSDAEALEVVVMEKRKRVLGDDHPDTLTSMANLAVTYWKQGRWNDAKALEVVVLEKRKRVLGDDHPDTLTSMENLAATYRDQGRLNDAEALQVR
ncbi:acyl transferase/acyl hydrolase/lysophospholipase [Flammula alnicola]|nr:acyl transferase/acyl hydrolase/lysophospholipase [Flammula alnicola]